MSVQFAVTISACWLTATITTVAWRMSARFDLARSWPTACAMASSRALRSPHSRRRGCACRDERLTLATTGAGTRAPYRPRDEHAGRSRTAGCYAGRDERARVVHDVAHAEHHR